MQSSTPRRIPLARWFLVTFLTLVVLTAVAAFGGLSYGRVIAAAGHTDSLEPRRIAIADTKFLVPENAIRFEQARRDGEHARLDLHLRWPELEGYTPQARDDFHHAEGSRRIVFVSLEPRLMELDMSSRLVPVYSRLIKPAAQAGPPGLVLYRFAANSGFADEELVVGRHPPQPPFVARCQADALAAQSLAPCKRDLAFGEELSLVYRFPRELLGEWRALDEAVIERARDFQRAASEEEGGTMAPERRARLSPSTESEG